MTLIDAIFYLAALAVGLLVRDVRTILLLCLAIVVAHAVFLFVTLADATGERDILTPMVVSGLAIVTVALLAYFLRRVLGRATR